MRKLSGITLLRMGQFWDGLRYSNPELHGMELRNFLRDVSQGVRVGHLLGLIQGLSELLGYD